MFFAAQLLALTIEHACFLSAEPGVAHKTWNSVLLDAESRHRKSVNHVIGCGDDADFFTNRHNHGVVYFEQVIVARRLARVGHFALRIVQGRNEANAFAFTLDVIVAPLPLIARGFDGEVGVGGVFLGHQNFGGW